ncbi:hypothetical protein SAMN05216267_1003290 [Actinacidiphila rubida]|uniref:Uncharacterized protein n=1 Tax=Actinacidiphila rubida TaxID=310780 RepID=A0A1H8FFF0_9ACTN|nr:hypothetical protein [Actinacidiphila rubida]SEN30422.1 hypothetical protein SAMN05216267_1003290 [Actinacidiphila rubida]
MSEATPTEHASEPAGGRHRGAASREDSGQGHIDAHAPHGRHRRVQDN